MPSPRRTGTLGALVAAVLVAVAACGIGGEMEDGPKGLPTVSVADTTTLAKRYAEEINRIVGGQVKTDDISSLVSPCEDSDGNLSKDGSYTLFHSYNIALPTSRHPEQLTRLRDFWISQGYEITTFMTFASGNGAKVGAASRRGDGIGFYVDTVEGDWLSVAVSSGCRKPMPGETAKNPARAEAEASYQRIRDVLG